MKKEKVDAMLHYAEAVNDCRTRLILEYFGEQTYTDCGHCDYCVDKKHQLAMADHERIREMVRYELRKGPRFPEELTRLFANYELPLAEEIIRGLTDTDEVHYDEAGRLRSMTTGHSQTPLE